MFRQLATRIVRRVLHRSAVRTASFASDYVQGAAATLKRSHLCGQLRETDADRDVELAGWLASPRMLGGLGFAPLRDNTGFTQLVFGAEILDQVRDLPNEAVVAVSGKVKPRPAAQVRTDIGTGSIEVLVTSIRRLNNTDPLPFPLVGAPPSEEVRLQHRYIDLRRPVMQHMLKKRSEAVHAARQWLQEQSFFEIETPLLFRATPEGAREFIVPTRTPDRFYALPQSPQQFKQMLMAGGVMKYYQVARCFRDEGSRKDRQPEFSQLDMEMAFATAADVQHAIEGSLAAIFRVAADVHLPTPFRHMKFSEALSRYGSDKPDLRFELPLCSMKSLAAESGVQSLVDGAATADNDVVVLRAPGFSASSAALSSVLKAGTVANCKTLLWKLSAQGEWSGAGAKYVTRGFRSDLAQRAQVVPGDALIVISGPQRAAQQAGGAARLELASIMRSLKQLPEVREHACLWVDDFPLFEPSADHGLQSTHHPFTAPLYEDISLLETAPLSVRGQHYDVVIDGVELGGGSVRIHDARLQSDVFKMLGIQAAEQTFGHLLNALRSGCPPHAGCAIGLDRALSVALQTPSIRDVIAFPKTTSGQDLLTGAPTALHQAALDEYHIKVSGKT
eukprot:TRINITY_DN12375_c0_g1_i1.p1 TRINITY_DN12375_c0_g1~~TRINITY_DN12375_c0_g1_i1.p1  ORF type:complete len:618 (-),score=130.24 TRINITY_DN12375_c0_g1_i1:8-1861(-)